MNMRAEDCDEESINSLSWSIDSQFTPNSLHDRSDANRHSAN
jgi:hypothetical protein